MKEKEIIGLYPMVADIMHTGHVIALEEAAKHCDKLIVALHCCPDYKKPIQSIYERYIQLKSLRCVDEVIPYTDKNDMCNLLLSYDFDIYFLGQDHEGKDFECKDVLENLNKEIYYTSRKHPYSSTYFKNKVKNND